MEVEPRQRNGTDKRPGYALLYVSSDAACVFLISLLSAPHPDTKRRSTVGAQLVCFLREPAGMKEETAAH